MASSPSSPQRGDLKLNSSRSRQLVKRILQAGRLAVFAVRDAVRFWRYAALSSLDPRYDQLVGRIMYNVHALEKGLAQTHDWKPRRGSKAIRNLNDALATYLLAGYDETSFEYAEGVSILKRYIERHESASEDVSFLADIVDQRFLNPPPHVTCELAGLKEISKRDKDGNATKPFYDLSQGRSSIRLFSGRPISTVAVMAALRNAEKTPSVCNRQGWRVYWTEDKELARRILVHQRGFGHSQMPEVLLTITVTNGIFNSPVERNQSFVDGGLYAMSVLYGLEAEGLGAVPLNACMYMRDQAAVRDLLAMDPAQDIIMFIAVGDMPETALVPISDRRSTSAFLTVR